MKTRIKASERKRQDILRQNGLKTAKTYTSRLYKARRAEVRRVLDYCMDYQVDNWPDIARAHLEEPYLFDLLKRMMMATAIPQAEQVAKDLSRQKDDPLRGLWEDAVDNYATFHLGERITSMEATLATEFSQVMGNVIEAHHDMGIDKLARLIFRDFCGETLLWQCRRIARTESMLAMAKGADVAATSLGVQFSKTWSNSGLANTRESHLEMDGVTVGQDEFFIVRGANMLYPHDGDHGAPAGEIVNCACTCIRRPI